MISWSLEVLFPGMKVILEGSKLFKAANLNYTFTRPQRWSRWRWRICLQRPGNCCAFATLCRRPVIWIQMLHQTRTGEEGSWCLVTIFWWGVTWGEEWPGSFAFPGDKQWDTVFEDSWYLSSTCECTHMCICFSWYLHIYNRRLSHQRDLTARHPAFHDQLGRTLWSALADRIIQSTFRNFNGNYLKYVGNSIRMWSVGT